MLTLLLSIRHRLQLRLLTDTSFAIMMMIIGTRWKVKIITVHPEDGVAWVAGCVRGVSAVYEAAPPLAPHSPTLPSKCDHFGRQKNKMVMALMTSPNMPFLSLRELAKQFSFWSFHLFRKHCGYKQKAITSPPLFGGGNEHCWKLKLFTSYRVWLIVCVRVRDRDWREKPPVPVCCISAWCRMWQSFNWCKWEPCVTYIATHQFP